MADFSIQTTGQDAIANEVTPKAGVRDDSLAQFVGAAGQATEAGLEIYGTKKAQDFRKDAESGYRLTLGLDEKMGEANAPETASLLEFKRNVDRYGQMSKMGLGTKAQLLLEMDMRQRMDAEPYLADRYRQVAAGLKSDYAQITQAADEAYAAGQKVNDKRLARIDKWLFATGTTTEVPDGMGGLSFVPLDAMSEDQLNWIEQKSQLAYNQKKAGDAMWDAQARAMQVESHGFSRNAEGRAQGSYGMSVQNFNDTNYQKNYIGATTARLSREIYDKASRIASNPQFSEEEKSRQLRALEVDVAAQVKENLLLTPSGNPTGIKPSDAAAVGTAIISQTFAPLHELYIGENSLPSELQRKLDAMDRQAGYDLGMDAARIRATVNTFGPAGGVAVAEAILAERGADNALITGVSENVRNLGRNMQEINGAKLSTINQAATEGIGAVPQEEQRSVLGAFLGRLRDISNPNYPYTSEISSNPVGYAGAFKGVVDGWEQIGAGDRQIAVRATLTPQVISAISQMPAPEAKVAAENAGAILSTYGRSVASQMSGASLEYDDQAERFTGNTPGVQQLNSMVQAAKVYESLIPGGSTEPAYLLNKYFGMEVQTDEATDGGANGNP